VDTSTVIAAVDTLGRRVAASNFFEPSKRRSRCDGIASLSTTERVDCGYYGGCVHFKLSVVDNIGCVCPLEPTVDDSGDAQTWATADAYE